MMTRIALIGLMLTAALAAGAQDCTALLLPFFRGNTTLMSTYPPDKLEWYCCYVRAAFYESDTVPAGADLFSITEVKEKNTNAALAADFVVDLNTLSYYAYNFYDFQARYHYGNKTLCFSTPSSAHPYLVLRSLDDMNALAQQMFDNRPASDE